MEISNEENLEKLGEEQKRARRTFGIGFVRGLSILGAFCKYDIKLTENEEADLCAGQICGIASTVVMVCAILFSVFIGG